MPLFAADVDRLFPLLTDAELWQYVDERPPESLAALRERYRRWERRRSPDGAELRLNWVVESGECGAVGFVQATVAPGGREAAIAYVLARRYWSRGFGTEAVAALLGFLRDGLHVVGAVAVVDERNVASLRLLRRLGFATIDDGDARNLRLGLNLRAV